MEREREREDGDKWDGSQVMKAKQTELDQTLVLTGTKLQRLTWYVRGKDETGESVEIKG